MVALLPLAGTVIGALVSIGVTAMTNRHSIQASSLERAAIEASERAALQRAAALALLDGPLPAYWRQVGDEAVNAYSSAEPPLAALTQAMSPLTRSWDDVYRLVVRISDQPTREAVAQLNAVCMNLLARVSSDRDPTTWANHYGDARDAYWRAMQMLGVIAAQ